MLPLEGWVSQALRTCGPIGVTHANSPEPRSVAGTAEDSLIAGSLSSSETSSSEVVDDLAEDLGDLRAKHREHDDRDHGDQKE